MKQLLIIMYVIFVKIVCLNAQTIEVNAGYPFRLTTQQNEDSKLANANNFQVGIAGEIYIRYVSVQLGINYLSNNYSFTYPSSTSAKRSVVSHYYIALPLMVYPKLFADGKNIVSVGVGANFMIPSKIRGYVEHYNGERNAITDGQYKTTIMPRISVRYCRYLGKSFLLSANIFTDITVMDSYYDDSSNHWGATVAPWYYSPATVGGYVSIGYIIPSSKNYPPRYFEKWKTKTKD